MTRAKACAVCGKVRPVSATPAERCLGCMSKGRQCRDCGATLYYDNCNVRCLRCASRHGKEKSKPRLPLEPGNYMQAGRGERHDDCVDYDKCLKAHAKRSDYQGHCPVACVGYKQVRREFYTEWAGDGMVYPNNGGT